MSNVTLMMRLCAYMCISCDVCYNVLCVHISRNVYVYLVCYA